MACCYTEDCGEYAVTPMLIAPCYPTKCCEEPPLCYPCLPRCPKQEIVYCCEKKSKTSPQTPSNHDGDCCDGHHSRQHRDSTPPRQGKCSPHPGRNTSSTTNRSPPNYCPTCCQPTCKPVKTKYVIPCYRYEDGRIERYVPTHHGRLPMSAYRRNGIQDQIHGYRGAMRYLCAGEGTHGCCVHMAIEPLRKLYPKVTQEMMAVKKKKEKK